jgi:hypothetical protein
MGGCCFKNCNVAYVGHGGVVWVLTDFALYCIGKHTIMPSHLNPHRARLSTAVTHESKVMRLWGTVQNVSHIGLNLAFSSVLNLA